MPVAKFPSRRKKTKRENDVAALLRKARQGDPAAKEQLWQKYGIRYISGAEWVEEEGG